jgi:hypothetical protein
MTSDVRSGSLLGRSSVDDSAPSVRGQRRQAFLPGLECLGRLSRPVGDFPDDPERGTTAVRPGRVSRKFLVGHVRIVLELSGRLDDVDARYAVTGRKLSSETGTVGKRSEIDVIHHDVGTIVRPEARAKEITDPEIGFRAVIVRPLVERLTHGNILENDTKQQRSTSDGEPSLLEHPRGMSLVHDPRGQGCFAGRSLSMGTGDVESVLRILGIRLKDVPRTTRGAQPATPTSLVHERGISFTGQAAGL